MVDTFSIPTPSEEPKRPKHKPDNKPDGKEPDHPEIPSLTQGLIRYRVSRADGGFTITQGNYYIRLPAELSCKVFYDRRGGRAKYSQHDFCLDKNLFKLNPKEQIIFR